MKKAKHQEPKPKEFAAKPFAALKGVQPAAPPAPAAKVSPPQVQQPAATAEDGDLFLRAMADVRRMGNPETKSGKVPAPQAAIRPVVRRIDEDERRLFLDTLKGLKLDVTFRDGAVEEDDGIPAPQSVNRMRQLRRGTIRIDYELDLHGLTRDEALEALARFVGGAFNRGQQAVLVITGRGNNSPGEPVLQRAVTGWLKGDGRQFVAEFSLAPRNLGGDGAVVVFLKGKDAVVDA